MKSLIGYNAITRDNALTFSYVYNIIDENNNMVTKNVKESLTVLPTDIEAINGNNAVYNFINNRINPVVAIVLGNITINYKSEDGTALQTPVVLTNLKLATYFYTATKFADYNLIGNSINSITLTNEIPSGIITFTYAKILKGNITLCYKDENDIDLETPTVNSNLDLATYTYNNKVFSGYTLSGDTSKTVILSSDNLNQTIIFTYMKDVVTP